MSKERRKHSPLTCHFHEHRDHYLASAKIFYKQMQEVRSPSNPVLRGDLLPVLDAAFKADPMLADAMISNVGSALNAAYNKWHGIFAAFVVDTEWDEITKTEEG